MLLKTLAVMWALTLLAACSASADSSGNRGDRNERELVGVVVDVESVGLTEVRSFTVRHRGQDTMVFLDDDTDLGFTPSHLHEHRATGEPVRVETRTQGDRLVATSVEDA
jgi:hypothetical protein